MVRIAGTAVERGAAAAEFRIFPVAGMTVELPDGAFQPGRVDAALARQLIQRAPSLQVARAQVRPDRDRKRLGHAERVAALERVVADQPGGDLLAFRNGPDHRRDEVVVAVCLVHEAAAVSQHRDQPGLAAVDDVRVQAHSSTPIWHQGNRAPRHRRGQTRLQLAAGRLPQADPVSGARVRGQRPVFLAGRRARKQLAAAVDVGRKTARRQYGAAPGPDRHLAARRVDHRALYRAIVDQQALGRRGHP